MILDLRCRVDHVDNTVEYFEKGFHIIRTFHLVVQLCMILANAVLYCVLHSRVTSNKRER